MFEKSKPAKPSKELITPSAEIDERRGEVNDTTQLLSYLFEQGVKEQRVKYQGDTAVLRSTDTIIEGLPFSSWEITAASNGSLGFATNTYDSASGTIQQIGYGFSDTQAYGQEAQYDVQGRKLDESPIRELTPEECEQAHETARDHFELMADFYETRDLMDEVVARLRDQEMHQTSDTDRFESHTFRSSIIVNDQSAPHEAPLHKWALSRLITAENDTIYWIKKTELMPGQAGVYHSRRYHINFFPQLTEITQYDDFESARGAPRNSYRDPTAQELPGACQEIRAILEEITQETRALEE